MSRVSSDQFDQIEYELTNLVSGQHRREWVVTLVKIAREADAFDEFMLSEPSPGDMNYGLELMALWNGIHLELSRLETFD